MGSHDESKANDPAATPKNDIQEGQETPSSAAGTRPSISHGASSVASTFVPAKDEAQRPPLPPRPSKVGGLIERPVRSRSNTLQLPRRTSRPQLQAGATTGLSLTDIHVHSYADGRGETYAYSAQSTPSRKSPRTISPAAKLRSYPASEADDTASILSSAPRNGAGTDVESILGDVLVSDTTSPGFNDGGGRQTEKAVLEMVPFDMSEPTADFNREFDELGDLTPDGSNEGR